VQRDEFRYAAMLADLYSKLGVWIALYIKIKLQLRLKRVCLCKTLF